MNSRSRKIAIAVATVAVAATAAAWAYPRWATPDSPDPRLVVEGPAGPNEDGLTVEVEPLGGPEARQRLAAFAEARGRANAASLVRTDSPFFGYLRVRVRNDSAGELQFRRPPSVGVAIDDEDGEIILPAFAEAGTNSLKSLDGPDPEAYVALGPGATEERVVPIWGGLTWITFYDRGGFAEARWTARAVVAYELATGDPAAGRAARSAPIRLDVSPEQVRGRAAFEEVLTAPPSLFELLARLLYR